MELLILVEADSALLPLLDRPSQLKKLLNILRWLAKLGVNILFYTKAEPREVCQKLIDYAPSLFSEKSILQLIPNDELAETDDSKKSEAAKTIIVSKCVNYHNSVCSPGDAINNTQQGLIVIDSDMNFINALAEKKSVVHCEGYLVNNNDFTHCLKLEGMCHSLRGIEAAENSVHQDKKEQGYKKLLNDQPTLKIKHEHQISDFENQVYDLMKMFILDVMAYLKLPGAHNAATLNHETNTFLSLEQFLALGPDGKYEYIQRINACYKSDNTSKATETPATASLSSEILRELCNTKLAALKDDIVDMYRGKIEGRTGIPVKCGDVYQFFPLKQHDHEKPNSDRINQAIDMCKPFVENIIQAAQKFLDREPFSLVAVLLEFAAMSDDTAERVNLFNENINEGEKLLTEEISDVNREFEKSVGALQRATRLSDYNPNRICTTPPLEPLLIAAYQQAFDACKTGDISKLEEALRTPRFNITHADLGTSKTLFETALLNAQIDVARFLLTKIDINFSLGYHPIFSALCGLDLDPTKYELLGLMLFEHEGIKLSPHYKDKEGNTPLHIAVMLGNVNAVEMLARWLRMQEAKSKEAELSKVELQKFRALSEKNNEDAQTLLRSLQIRLAALSGTSQSAETNILTQDIHQLEKRIKKDEENQQKTIAELSEKAIKPDPCFSMMAVNNAGNTALVEAILADKYCTRQPVVETLIAYGCGLSSTDLVKLRTAGKLNSEIMKGLRAILISQADDLLISAQISPSPRAQLSLFGNKSRSSAAAFASPRRHSIVGLDISKITPSESGVSLSPPQSPISTSPLLTPERHRTKSTATSPACDNATAPRKNSTPATPLPADSPVLATQSPQSSTGSAADSKSSPPSPATRPRRGSIRDMWGLLSPKNPNAPCAPATLHEAVINRDSNAIRNMLTDNEAKNNRHIAFIRNADNQTALQVAVLNADKPSIQAFYEAGIYLSKTDMQMLSAMLHDGIPLAQVAITLNEVITETVTKSLEAPSTSLTNTSVSPRPQRKGSVISSLRF